MSEEKKIFCKTLNNIVATNRIDNEESYILNNYISCLESALQQKENIIKEVREYIEKHIAIFKGGDMLVDMNINELLEILDKEVN